MSLASQVLRLWEDRRVRLGVAALAFAGLTAITYLIAHPRMYIGFAAYDDEGYMLTALKGFIDHGHLYDDVFTQYGPFYYEAWGGLFSLFGIPVTHDGGRAVTLVAWLGSSLAFGLVTMRVTANLLLGLAVQMLVFTALVGLCTEPMHPGGIICLLLAAIVCISSFVSDRVSPFAMAALGGAVAALLLVKINLGVFAIAAVVLACTVSYRELSSRRWLRLAVEVGFVAIPFLLMASKLGETWALRYALQVGAAALAVVIALRAHDRQQREGEELGWLVGGFVLVAVFVCVTILATGTSLGGLLNGVIGQPLRQADAFTIPFQIAQRLQSTAILALGAAIAYWYVSRRRSGPLSPALVALLSLFSIGVGMFMAMTVIGTTVIFDSGNLIGYSLGLLPFAWLALVSVEQPDSRPQFAFARLLLPLLAVLQALHAYPVAGSQVLWSSFLLIPVGAICVGNGVAGLKSVLGDPVDRRAVAGFGAVAALVVLGFLANTTLREPLKFARADYDAAAPLELPGAERVRLRSGEEVEIYSAISAAVKGNCAALVMLPGMDSFYLWTEQDPPTGYTATGWPTLFNDSAQQRVIDDTRSIPDLCLLKNIPLAAGWGNGKIPRGPLIDYLNRGFVPIAKIQNYGLYRRDEPLGGGS